MNLEKKLNLISNFTEPKPEIFDLSRPQEAKKLEALFKTNKKIKVYDDFYEQTKELFFTNNPDLTNNTLQAEKKFTEFHTKKLARTSVHRLGKWVYFPWLDCVSHVLDEKDFFQVRTSRNRQLVSAQEQKKFYEAKIGIGGLSVGSSIAIALVLQGGAKHIKLADPDILALSNTNRVISGVQNLGQLKIYMVGQKIYETNPYAQISFFPFGLNEENMNEFTYGLDLVIDELDNLAVKVLLREKAREKRIPVISGADNGNSAVIDIERYDQNHKLAFFHNRLGKISYKQLNSLNKLETGKNIAKLIGPENHEHRMLKSLLEIGKTITSWPQLGSTALLNAAAVSYCARQIVNNKPLQKNRSVISLEEKFAGKGYAKKKARQQKSTQKYISKIFGL